MARAGPAARVEIQSSRLDRTARAETKRADPLGKRFGYTFALSGGYGAGRRAERAHDLGVSGD
jgi:hypothetical protein